MAKDIKARPFGRLFGSAIAAAVAVRRIVDEFIPIVEFFQAALRFPWLMVPPNGNTVFALANDDPCVPLFANVLKGGAGSNG